jgi:peptidoglycan/xylan/chitin deacetylase (PgdA/CDA1 family)
MSPVRDQALVIHFDLDSPNTLLRFWGCEQPAVDLDAFFTIALGRALEFLDDVGASATFFCVGGELERSDPARRLLREACRRGHELANHTYSHPYGFTQLSEDRQQWEIRECSRVIGEIAGAPPSGFRAPGYDANTAVVNLLEAEGFSYDSSAFWSLFNPLFRVYHRFFSASRTYNGLVQSSRHIPQAPYYPSRGNWTERGPERALLELPLPRVGPGGLPFYNNFLLTVGAAASRYLVSCARQQHLVYLFHLIEFVDLSDGLPSELRRHPNVQTSVNTKIRLMKETLSLLAGRYEIQPTRDVVSRIRKDGVAR